MTRLGKIGATFWLPVCRIRGHSVTQRVLHTVKCSSHLADKKTEAPEVRKINRIGRLQNSLSFSISAAFNPSANRRRSGQSTLRAPPGLQPLRELVPGVWNYCHFSARTGSFCPAKCSSRQLLRLILDEPRLIPNLVQPLSQLPELSWVCRARQPSHTQTQAPAWGLCVLCV